MYMNLAIRISNTYSQQCHYPIYTILKVENLQILGIYSVQKVNEIWNHENWGVCGALYTASCVGGRVYTICSSPSLASSS